MTKKFLIWISALSLLVIAASLFLFSRVIREGFYYVANGGDFKEQYIHYFNLFHDLVRSGEMPYWSWNYSIGGSFWNDFGYYMLGDIFIWPLLMFPKELFPATIIPLSILKLTIMAVGSFLLFKKLGVKNHWAFLGAISYSFTGKYFELFYTHYFFVNGAVFFPLILLGYERYLQEKKWLLFVLTIFLSAISNFYFFFMLTLGLGFYSIFRFFAQEFIAKNFKSFFVFHLRLILFYLLGLILALPIFLPSALSFLKSNALHRPDMAIESSMGIEFLMNMIFFTGGYNLIPVLFSLILFFAGRKYLPYAILNLVLLIIAFIPELTRVFGALSKPEEFRSFFMVNLLLTLTAVVAINNLDFKRIKNITILSATGIGIVLWLVQSEYTHYAGLLAFLILIFIAAFIGRSWVANTGIKYGLSAISVIIPLIFGYLAANSFVTDLLTKTKGTGEPIAHKGAWSPFPLMSKEKYELYYENDLVKETIKPILQEEGFHRALVQYKGVLGLNSAMTYGYNSYSAYQTLLPWSIQQFEMDVLALPGSRVININKGYMNSTYMHALTANKYAVYIKPDPNLRFPFYGYEKQDSPTQDSVIYKNRFNMPLGFVYNTVMTEKEFNKVPYGYRDRVLFEHAVVPEGFAKNKKVVSADVPASVSRINETSKLEFSDNAKVTQNDQGYLVEAEEPYTITVPIKPHDYGQLSAELNMVPYTNDEGIAITATSSAGQIVRYEKNITANQYKISQYHYSDTINDVNFNFGIDEKSTNITLKFNPGRFLIKDLDVYLDNFDGLQAYKDSREEQGLKITRMTNNTFKGHVFSESEGVMFISIPYHKGWKVLVDGEEVETFPVHGMFLGVEVSSGKHSINAEFTPSGLF